MLVDRATGASFDVADELVQHEIGNASETLPRPRLGHGLGLVLYQSAV
ncbi:hypothetical protein [Luteitalea sp.]